MPGFQTYEQLQDLLLRAVAKGEAYRTDVQEWIWLAEVRVHQDLQLRLDEVTDVWNGVAGEVALPADFYAMGRITPQVALAEPLEPASRRIVLARRNDGGSVPEIYYVQGARLVYDTAGDQDFDVEYMTGADHFYASPNGTDLSSRYPNLLFYAALIESVPWLGQEGFRGEEWIQQYAEAKKLVRRLEFNQKIGSGRTRQRSRFRRVP